MIPKECKRLAEVDFRIAVVSKHSASDKYVRHKPNTALHPWWAQRPLAACRAMLLALLLPDPCDEHCPEDFKEKARSLLTKTEPTVGPEDEDLRKAFLDFIGDFADGIASVVFAHKTTEGWEALLSGIIRGGWTVTGSWPIATERGARLLARNTAALATSVHLVCRPRDNNAPIADWEEVLGELPKRVGDWMERLQNEGIRGADLVFACIGPALEIYSKYSKVEDAQGREIPLGGDPEAVEPHERGYLSYVWETVGRVALEQVLGTAEAKARNGAAGAVEEDARLTALFLWTLQSTNGAQAAEVTESTENADNSNTENEEGEESSATSVRSVAKGYSLIYDVVRRFAQPLGIRLPDWEGRIIETKKGIVRLLAVSERAKQLFGEAGASAIADRLEEEREVSPQMMLFPDLGQAPKIKGRRKKAGASRSAEQAGVSDEALQAQRGATTLDRVHAAMLLQASGRANALRALIKAEQQRGPDFLRLANALSALYPKNSEEKRLIDAMLLAVPR